MTTMTGLPFTTLPQTSLCSAGTNPISTATASCRGTTSTFTPASMASSVLASLECRSRQMKTCGTRGTGTTRASCQKQGSRTLKFLEAASLTRARLPSRWATTRQVCSDCLRSTNTQKRRGKRQRVHVAVRVAARPCVRVSVCGFTDVFATNMPMTPCIKDLRTEQGRHYPVFEDNGLCHL